MSYGTINLTVLVVNTPLTHFLSLLLHPKPFQAKFTQSNSHKTHRSSLIIVQLVYFPSLTTYYNLSMLYFLLVVKYCQEQRQPQTYHIQLPIAAYLGGPIGAARTSNIPRSLYRVIHSKHGMISKHLIINLSLIPLPSSSVCPVKEPPAPRVSSETHAYRQREKF